MSTIRVRNALALEWAGVGWVCLGLFLGSVSNPFGKVVYYFSYALEWFGVDWVCLRLFLGSLSNLNCNWFCRQFGLETLERWSGLGWVGCVWGCSWVVFLTLSVRFFVISLMHWSGLGWVGCVWGCPWVIFLARIVIGFVDNSG